MMFRVERFSVRSYLCQILSALLAPTPIFPMHFMNIFDIRNVFSVGKYLQIDITSTRSIFNGLIFSRIPQLLINWCIISSALDEVQRELGTGTFGKVFQCNDRKYNQKVAVKVVRSIKVSTISQSVSEGTAIRLSDSLKMHFSLSLCSNIYGTALFIFLFYLILALR